MAAKTKAVAVISSTRPGGKVDATACVREHDTLLQLQKQAFFPGNLGAALASTLDLEERHEHLFKHHLARALASAPACHAELARWHYEKATLKRATRRQLEGYLPRSSRAR
jgi:hypothetical protein